MVGRLKPCPGTPRTPTPAMADISRILYLPSPPVGGGNSRGAGDSRAVIPGAQKSESSQAEADQIRARQFRFRVYDGGRAEGGDNGVPTRRADFDTLGFDTDETAGDTENTATRRQALGFAGTGSTNGSAGTSRQAASGQAPSGLGLATPSAPFLAQLIAQEQLQPGLYDPPLKAADRAYRQAGGQPAWTEGNAQALFRMAV